MKWPESRALLTALLLVAITGCRLDFGTSGSDGERAQPRSVTLKRLADCSEVAQYLIGSARWETTHPVSEAGGGGTTGVLFPPTAGAAALDAPDHTGTNVQTEGVDEPDIAKTDGNHLYLLSGGFLVILKAWPPADLAELSRTPIKGSPVSLLLHADRAVVFTQEWSQTPATLGDGAFVCKSNSLLRAVVFNVADRSAPTVEREITAEGSFLDARLSGGLVSFVVSNQPGWLYPLAVSGADAALAEEVLPTYKDADPSEADPGQTAGSCADTYAPDIPVSTGMITVFTLDLNSPDSPLGSTKLLGTGERVYASATSLVVAAANSSQWLWAGPQGTVSSEPEASTALHLFTLSNPPAYVASAKVSGWLTSGFSLDEHAGHLRVATTRPQWVTGQAVENAVHVLSEAGGGLAEVATLTGLGKPGESIFAVRFLGNRGYVVTFLQTDPLYVLDLADPLAPKIAGQLEVDGVSTYLHPMDGGHLIAVGRGAGASGGVLSLFDVADPANPKLTASATLGEGSWSEAQYDHHAFTWFPSRSMLALPVTRWTGSPWVDASTASVFSGLTLFTVDVASGFTLAGEVDHSLFYKEASTGKWYYPEPLRRSFFISDEINGDVLYSISALGVKATDADDLTRDLASSPLPSTPYYWTSETRLVK